MTKENDKPKEAEVTKIEDKTTDTRERQAGTNTTMSTTNKKQNVGQTQSILVAIALVAGLGSACYSIYDFVKGQTPITINYGADGNSVNFSETSIAAVAAKVTPAVVSIKGTVSSTNYFGQSTSSEAAGTGMIVTSDGYILTNKHVVEDLKNITVVLDDGTAYDDVKLVGTDPLNDIAFLKINNVSDLPTVTLGDSKTISSGQQVIAIGNALGQFQNTITSGVVSGTNRSITASDSSGYNSETLSDLIQTDAAINSGNSGGPLVNAAGEVIGINVATTSSADGVSFAIPIASVKGMLNYLIENGSLERAYLGVSYVAITPDVAKELDLPVSSGAYLYASSRYSAIASNSPAEQAGLKDKDIITKINGVEVGEKGSVQTLIAEYKPGDTVQITYIRDKIERTVNVTLGAYSER